MTLNGAKKATPPTHTVVMKIPAPTTPPTARSGEFDSVAEKELNRSGAPLPSASSVTPATFCESCGAAEEARAPGHGAPPQKSGRLPRSCRQRRGGAWDGPAALTLRLSEMMLSAGQKKLSAAMPSAMKRKMVHRICQRSTASAIPARRPLAVRNVVAPRKQTSRRTGRVPE